MQTEKIVCWDEPGQEDLRFSDEYEAIQCILEDTDDPLPEKIVLCGFARMEITPTIVPHPLEDLLDQLDDEYGNPNGDPTEPTEAMEKAEKRFLKAIYREYLPWACEEVVRKEIDVKKWIAENRPDLAED